MLDGFGVDRGDTVSKGDYTSAVDQSLTHRRKATRRLTGAEIAEATGGAAAAGAVFIPTEARRRASNKVFTKPYAHASSRRGIAEFTEDAKGAAKWGKRERVIQQVARGAAHPFVLPAAILGAGIGTGLALRSSAANHNRKSNKIARQYNKTHNSRIAVVGLGSKTSY